MKRLESGCQATELNEIWKDKEGDKIGCIANKVKAQNWKKIML